MAVDTAEAKPPEVVAPRRVVGWLVIARKEFADHVTSLRFVILIALMGVAAMSAVYAVAGGIRGVAEQATGSPALFLRLFTVSPENLPPFYILVGWLAPLLGIAFGFDAVNGERAQGTLPRLLAQPIHRDDVINGKFVAGLSVIALMLTMLTALVTGVGFLRIGITPKFPEVLRLIVFLIVTVFYAGFWLALATLFSVVIRRAATSALAVIAAWLVFTFFAGILIGIAADVLAPLPEQATIEEGIRNARMRQSVSRISPTTLYAESTVALLNPQTRTFDILGLLLLQTPGARAVPSVLSLSQSMLLVWQQVTALVALTVICFAAAYISFMRQEIRA